jgi:hypothetical protein
MFLCIKGRPIASVQAWGGREQHAAVQQVMIHQTGGARLQRRVCRILCVLMTAEFYRAAAGQDLQEAHNRKSLIKKKGTI